MRGKIADFANGAPEAQSMFEKLGITLEQVSSQSAMSNFALIAQAIQSTIPPAEQATQSMELFKRSMGDAVKVAEQYDNILKRQQGGYATDKEVQNAISLSKAIGILGEKLTAYISKADNATSVSNAFSRSLEEMWDYVKRNQELLSALSIEYANYVASLKSSVSSTLDASTALNVFSSEVRDLSDDIEFLKTATDDWEVTGMLDEEDIGELSKRLETLENFLKSAKSTIQDEIDAVIGIMNQRIKAGAPIDTRELETAVSHVKMLREALQTLPEMRASLGVSQDGLDDFEELLQYVDRAERGFSALSLAAENANSQMLFKEASQSVERIEDDINRLKRELSKAKKVNVDTEELEKARYELELIAQQRWELKVDSNDVDALREKVERLKGEIAAIQQRSALGTSIFQPAIIAIDKIKAGLKGVKSTLESISWESITRGLKSCWEHVTRFRSETNKASDATGNLGNLLKQGAGRVLGMGSAMALVATAWRNVVRLVQEYVKNLAEAKEMNAYGNAANAADDLKRVSDKSDKKREDLGRKLAEFADLYEEEQKTGSTETRAKRINLQEELKSAYGFEFEMVNGEIKNIDAQITRKLDELARSRIEAIDAQIEANQEVVKGVQKYTESFHYGKRLLYTVVGGADKYIEKASERATEAGNSNMELMERKRALQNENLSGQYLRLRAGRRTDEAQKEENEAAEKLQKAQDEQAKALEDATEKLEEWRNSLNDNERQKNLRSIFARYYELTDAGVNEEEARNVALQEITQMLQRERDEEDRKNKELLKAVNSKIEQYKSAYKEYQEARVALKQAQQEEVRVKRENARRERDDARQRRRDEIQRRKQQYGFSLYEGFNLNETDSARRQRRDNVRLDASIAEKMERSKRGERVHWTSKERERIGELQNLESKDKQLEAAQKQIEASDKQQQAAEALREAAHAIVEAEQEKGDAKRKADEARGELKEAVGQRRTRTTNGTAQGVFHGARRNGLNARGVKGGLSQQTQGYNQQLMQLHADLLEIKKRVFVVK